MIQVNDVEAVKFILLLSYCIWSIVNLRNGDLQE